MKFDASQIKKILQKEDPVILELGANIGNDTRAFLGEFKNIRLFCFEPDPRAIRHFKRSIQDDRCTLIEAAVSNSDGKTFLNMSSGWPQSLVPRRYKVLGLSWLYKFLHKNTWCYSSSIKQSISNPKDYPWLEFNKKIEVRTVRLDSWITEKNIGSVDFIWSDIQGAERDLIEGAHNTLKISKYFYTEYGAISSYVGALTKEETIELLRQHDFELISEHPSENNIGDLLFKNKHMV